MNAVLKRLFDILFAVGALVVSAPLLVVAALGVRATSPGPVLYRAHRVGRGGQVFAMHKFRTMHTGTAEQSAITAPGDTRIYPFGALLRRLKIDELPQFWDILCGHMSVVGPRPEDPQIVARDYSDWMRATLADRPGVTSPGAVYGYLYGEALLDPADPEGSYRDALLPPKLALERAYLERANVVRDLGWIWRTLAAVLAHARGRTIPLPAAEIEAARQWAPQGPYPSASCAPAPASTKGGNG